MDKLEAIRKIVSARDVIDSSKLMGILEVLDSDESEAEIIAEVYAKPRKQAIAEAKARMREIKKNL